MPVSFVTVFFGFTHPWNSNNYLNFAPGQPRPGDPGFIPVRIQDEPLENWIPDNFDALSPEEKKRVMDRLRFSGLRLRADIGEVVKLNRQTLDIP
jgi:hypothetical protein